MPKLTTSVPAISLFSLGGTIATTRNVQGMRPSLTASDLLDSIGDVRGIARLKAESLSQLPSSDIDFAGVKNVAARIREAIEEGGADGVVLTQGTDTLEETSFALDLLLEAGRPMVMTGAMRNSTLPGADGPANLLNAIRVAANAGASGLGVVVVMNDEIHAARSVAKTHTQNASAFASPSTGPLGWIANGRVRIVARPFLPSPTLRPNSEPPDIPIITLGLSSTSAAITPFLHDVPAGAVIASLGVGHVPTRTAEAIAALATRTPVVLASRVGNGEVYRDARDSEGPEVNLLTKGCISAGCLAPLKARVMLSLLLAEGADRARIEAVFADF